MAVNCYSSFIHLVIAPPYPEVCIVDTTSAVSQSTHPAVGGALLEHHLAEVNDAHQHPRIRLPHEVGRLAVVHGARDVRGAVQVLA